MLAKRLFKGVDIAKLSARPPDPYGARFMKFMRGTAFELDKAAQKEAQLDIDKIKTELVDALKKSLADMIRKAFMKKGSGGNGGEMKISLANFKEQQPAIDQVPETAKVENTVDVVVPEDAEAEAPPARGAISPSLDNLAES